MQRKVTSNSRKGSFEVWGDTADGEPAAAQGGLATTVLARGSEGLKKTLSSHGHWLPGSSKGAETAAMLFWARLPPGQTEMRKGGGWQSRAENPSDQITGLAA
ncbi:MAG: hypothetical protein ACRECP_09400 [Methylocella sp.]